MFKRILYKLETSTAWQLAIIILLPIIIYANAVTFDFIGFDDTGIILEKFEIMGNIKNLPKAFTTDAFLNPHGDFYRPIQTATFMIDAFVSGEKPWMYHLSNIVIHVLTCVALYYFLQLFSIKRFTAFLLSCVFAAHPLFATAVAWVPSRGDLLIGLFGLLLFISFVQFFRTKKWGWFIVHTLMFLLITFTKETTVLFPVFLLYYYFLVDKRKFSIKGLLPFGIVWLLVFGLYFFMRKQVVPSGTPADVFGIVPFFKNNPVIPTIVGKFFVPYPLSTLPLYNNIGTIIGILFLLGITYLTFEYSREKKWAALMGLGWFLLFIIPPTVYRLSNADTFFNYLEHRTYLPIIGLIIILGFFIDKLWTQAMYRKTIMTSWIIIVLVFSCLVFSHSNDYKSNFTFANKAANQGNATGYTMRAGRYLEKGDTAKAWADFNKAILLSPSATAYYERGKMYAKKQDHIAAEQDFSMAITLNAGLIDAYLARSVERRILKKYDQAFRDIYMAAKYDTLNPKVYFSFGNLFAATENYSEAVTSFSTAIALQKKFSDAYNNRAFAKLQLQDYAGCISDCDSAILYVGKEGIAAKHAAVFNNKAQAFAALNNQDSAFTNFNKAIQLNNQFKEAYLQRGIAYHKINQLQLACADWQQALKLGNTKAQSFITQYCK